MGQPGAVAAIASGKNMFVGGPQPRINLDAIASGLDPGDLQPEALGAGNTARRNQQMAAGDGPAILQRHADVAGHRCSLDALDHRHTVGNQRGTDDRHKRRIITGQQLVRLDDCHRTAKPTVRLRQFAANRPAA